MSWTTSNGLHRPSELRISFTNNVHVYILCYDKAVLVIGPTNSLLRKLLARTGVEALRLVAVGEAEEVSWKVALHPMHGYMDEQRDLPEKIW